LLKAGCTLELAWMIIRPIDKPEGFQNGGSVG